MLPETVQHTRDTLRAALQDTLDKNHLPGIAAALVHRGDVVAAEGLGKANLAGGVDVTAQTVFRIASISKTFAAVALMQLWEQGAFALHDPVNAYLKAFKLQHQGSTSITFHHLLTHTAGIGEFNSLWEYLNPRAHFNVVRPDKPVPELRHLYGQTLKAERPAGEKWCYANNGYATIGQLVADISGQPFPAYTRAHIFEPLGMETADFWRSERVRPGLAVGYSYKEKRQRFKPVPDLEQVTTAAGAMNASITDMARYMAALMGGGQNAFGRILKPETLELMFTPQFQLDPRLEGMGYGFKIDDWGGHRVVSHDGLWLGFVSSMFVAPDDELGIIVVTNRASSSAIGTARRLLQRALGYNPRPLKGTGSEPLPDTPERWPELVGFYSPAPGFNTNFRLWQAFGNEFEVYVHENELRIRALWGGMAEGYGLRRADPDDPLAFSVGLEPFIFRRDAAGQMVLLKDMITFYRQPDGASRTLSARLRPLFKLFRRLDQRIDEFRTR